jgi:hypothetical protein
MRIRRGIDRKHRACERHHPRSRLSNARTELRISCSLKYVLTRAIKVYVTSCGWVEAHHEARALAGKKTKPRRCEAFARLAVSLSKCRPNV